MCDSDGGQLILRLLLVACLTSGSRQKQRVRAALGKEVSRWREEMSNDLQQLAGSASEETQHVAFGAALANG